MPDTYLEEALTSDRVAQEVERVRRAVDPETLDEAVQLLAEALSPFLEAHYREKLEATLLDNWREENSPVDEAARQIAHGLPGTHAAWRGRTRGAISVALAAAFADLQKPDHTKTDERSSKEGTNGDAE